MAPAPPKLPLTATESIVRTSLSPDASVPRAVLEMTAMLGSEFVRSLLVSANERALKDAKREAFCILPPHVNHALEAYPVIKASVDTLPKGEAKKKKRGKDLFKGESHAELLAAQNALFAQAKALQDM
ncbi:hypothetical protein ACHHYP_01623 [Achlya hypogyna]|uniref:Transcription factor CBF/NF-Y/archaeal histone domain-containing protein n=1 Tax=Achlya hypogyna TaxID=1202772 RepID=A0A1V9Z818_ACHHY|nr:hypothetical protein ACHHYP_01623 [Achlya hypogyna]